MYDVIYSRDRRALVFCACLRWFSGRRVVVWTYCTRLPSWRRRNERAECVCAGIVIRLRTTLVFLSCVCIQYTAVQYVQLKLILLVSENVVDIDRYGLNQNWLHLKCRGTDDYQTYILVASVVNICYGRQRCSVVNGYYYYILRSSNNSMVRLQNYPTTKRGGNWGYNMHS